MRATAGAELLPQHTALIRASAIAPEVAAARGYRSVTDALALHELGYAGYQCRVPGLLLPVHSVAGPIVGSFYRPDSPRRDERDHPIKYELPSGSRARLDVPPAVVARLGHPSEPLGITEGARKADAAVSAGLDCLSIGGVWSWRGRNALGGLTALGDWESVHLAGRPIYLLFDSDVLDKRGVNLALSRLMHFLEGRDAHVRVCYLPPGESGGKRGLDDYLAAGGSLSRLLGQATRQLVAPTAPFRSGGTPAGNGHTPGAPLPVELDPARPHLTDLGNATRFVARHGEDLRYVPDWHRWLTWNGQTWQRDLGTGVEGRATDTVMALYREAAEELDTSRRAALAEHAKRSERRERLVAMVALAQAAEGAQVRPDDLDASAWLFACAGSVLDLRSGMATEARREDYLTKRSPVAWEPDAPCPVWEAFLARVLPDEAVRGFVQRAVGYSLTGETIEQCLFLLHGLGANGKSTFLETLRAIVGSYGEGTDFQTFLTRDRETVRNDLAKLRGARFVAASEIGAAGRFDEAVVKQITGSDTVTARFLYGEYFDFRPVFKVWLAANQRPVIRGTDHAIWRRVRLIPFEVQIPPEEQDRRLGDRLRAELPGILAWAVRGCLEWQRTGLAPPPAVQAATEHYREDMDLLGPFLADACVLHPQAEVAAGRLYELYRRFCEEDGGGALSQQAFGRSLTSRGLRNGRNRQRVRAWFGIGLRVDTEAEPGAGRM